MNGVEKTKPRAGKAGTLLSSFAGRWREVRITPRQWRTGAVVLVILILLTVFNRHIDVPALHEKASRMNGPMVFAAVTLLPLAGFPVSVLHAVAGVRFGMAQGFVLVAASIFLQLLAAPAIVKLAPAFFARRFDGLRRRLPKAAHRPLTIFTMLLPGAPYTAQIYVLPLAGVPLRTYLTWSLPINVARSIAGLAFGHFSDHFTPLSIVGFVLYGAAIMVMSAWSFQRLRRNLAGGRPPAEGGPTPAA